MGNDEEERDAARGRGDEECDSAACHRPQSPAAQAPFASWAPPDEPHELQLRAVDPDLAAILDEARAQIAAGVEPDAAALEARIRAVVAPGGGRALQQLDRLLAVARARRSLARPAPAGPATAAPSPARRREYRARPTIAANMAVRAKAEGEAVTLEWPSAANVASWEARISERPDPRDQYAEREVRALDGPRLELQLTELPLRIHLLGRASSGRLVQRAVISGLTALNWNQRWQQRASAS